MRLASRVLRLGYLTAGGSVMNAARQFNPPTAAGPDEATLAAIRERTTTLCVKVTALGDRPGP